MKFVVSLFTLLLVFSCSDMKKGSQMEQISDLQVRLDKISASWNSLELKSIDSLHQLSSQVIDSIELYYNDQTIEKSCAMALDDYKQCLIKLQEMQKIHTFLPIVLSEKSKALTSLKNDIELGSGRRDKYDDYISFEKKEVATISEQFEHYVELKKMSFEQYEASKQKVESFLDELKQEKLSIEMKR